MRRIRASFAAGCGQDTGVLEAEAWSQARDFGAPEQQNTNIVMFVNEPLHSPGLRSLFHFIQIALGDH
jgi:hypothetical protein